VPEERVHVMPAADGGVDLDGAAEAYARELGDTSFDVCLLSLGPDGHVASLFPEHPSSQAEGRAIAVRNSPKPPPERISLTLEVVNASTEVWLAATGSEKADAVALACREQDRSRCPAPARAAASALCGCWTERRRPGYRRTWFSAGALTHPRTLSKGV
jgi:6-phosphogluconolactonase